MLSHVYDDARVASCPAPDDGDIAACPVCRCDVHDTDCPLRPMDDELLGALAASDGLWACGILEVTNPADLGSLTRRMSRKVTGLPLKEEGRMKQRRNRFIRNAVTRGMRISDDGRLVHPSGFIEPARSAAPRKGYWKSTITVDGVTEVFTTARLVCWCALGEPRHGLVVDHIDGNSRNDHPSNLRWVTDSENALNVSESARALRRLRLGDTKRKLLPEDIKKIRDRVAAGETQDAIARDFLVSKTTVHRVNAGARTVAGGRCPMPRERTEEVARQALDHLRGLRLELRRVEFPTVTLDADIAEIERFLAGGAP